jgi:hypothetical protein
MKNIKTGFVSVFDILGYKSLIENNDIIQTAALISGFIERIPELMEEETVSHLKDIEYVKVQQAFNRCLEKIIISDTIVICMPFEDEKNNDDVFKTLIIASFLSYIEKLLKILCDKGLPVRGSIDYGQFYATKRSIAGRPFLDAFNLSEQLEFVGCAITDKAFEKICPSQEDTRYSKKIFKYLAPMKGAQNKRLYLLNWFHLPNNDIRQYLVDCFHSHSKDVPIRVYQKIDNTEIILRYAESLKR